MNLSPRPCVPVALAACLAASPALSDSLYDVSYNQGARIASYIVAKERLAERLQRVRTRSVGPRSVYAGGVRTGTQDVRCSRKDPSVTTETRKVEIELAADRNAVVHAEQGDYNLWWAICRGVYRKY